MKFFRRSFTIAVLAGSLSWTAGVSRGDVSIKQDAEGPLSELGQDIRILGRVGGLGTMEKLERDLRTMFRGMEADGVIGWTENDKDVREQLTKAELRIEFLAALLRLDLNGDFEVSQEEVMVRAKGLAAQPIRVLNNNYILPSQEQIEIIAQDIVENQMIQDKNKDGVIDRQELLAFADAAMPSGKSRFAARYPGVHHDLNDDGRVSEDEFIETVMAVARQVDANGDGTVTSQEVKTAISEEVRRTVIEK